MNRLRNRRKAKDEPAPRPSVDSEVSNPFKMFGRTKKSNEEPKKEVDLATALPSSDDFRTSLLMTGLSNRFSMLREQDDPASKLGKSFDDSVLHPRRQSRLDFSLGTGLHDIAEVSSIKAPSTRMDSFQSSDEGSFADGNIMNRGKPTEGNNLFGGRQKIYKITATGSGRALYDDDVALSAFQRWRQTEKERRSMEEVPADDAYDPGSLRSESPPHNDFNWRRGTSSTTSSAPSGARNSTAATSIASSQPAPSLKDWQPPSAASPNLSGQALLPERNVTRTRRLYEQTLTQDMQDQQSSALSRIDTLTKPRNRSNRTPDMAQNTTSPVGSVASDRPVRPMLSKASAPNLRSFSPSTPVSTQPSPSPGENGPTFPGLGLRTSQTATPPLSPPISETEELPTLPIEPNDRGKATALGFFSRPAQRYDENRYAQRQRQLQEGRDTPTSQDRPESVPSVPSEPASRPRSPSSLHDTPAGPEAPLSSTQPAVPEEGSVPTTSLPSLGDDRPRVGGEPPRLSLEPQGGEDHPALRKSAIPTPLTLSSRTSEEAPEKAQDVSPEDSPTLGDGPGLSGMVRQHLRHDSAASSVYGAVPPDTPNRLPDASQRREGGEVGTMDVDSNPWGNDGGSGETQPERADGEAGGQKQQQEEEEASGEGENEDFARHLADGARRVRERLTSYVDSESRATSPSALQEDYPPPPRTNALGSLRPGSSRSSLNERETRDTRDRNRSRLPRIPGIGSSPRESLDNVDEASRRGDVAETAAAAAATAPDASRSQDEKGGDSGQAGAHAGLKAFRQARRELQRMKEHELQQRRQAAPAPQQAPPPPPPGRGPPPVTYNRVPSDEAWGAPGSRPGSRARSDRERSGSEASNSGQPPLRPRLRAGSSAYDEQYQRSYSPTSQAGIHPAARVAGDARRSPAVSPYPGHGDAGPGGGSRPGSAAGGGGPMMAPSSTPNMAASPSAPPPLPPINPRRKSPNTYPLPAQGDGRRPLSPEKVRGGGWPSRAASEEMAGPAQYRQRLRRVTGETNGAGHAGWDSGSPVQTSHPGGKFPGGMI